VEESKWKDRGTRIRGAIVQSAYKRNTIQEQTKSTKGEHGTLLWVSQALNSLSPSLSSCAQDNKSHSYQAIGSGQGSSEPAPVDRS